jgi:hypothetical protein
MNVTGATHDRCSCLFSAAQICEMTLQSQGSFMQFALRNNIVAIEHGASFVSRDCHCNTLWNASAHHVANGSTPQIMEEFPRNTRATECALKLVGSSVSGLRPFRRCLCQVSIRATPMRWRGQTRSDLLFKRSIRLHFSVPARRRTSAITTL